MGAIHSGLVGSAGASLRGKPSFTFAANASNQTVAVWNDLERRLVIMKW